MKKVLLMPDSFKGTLSSAAICEIMETAVAAHFPDAEVIKIPVADGGEGSVDAYLEAVGGEKRFVTVKNPFFEDMESFYGVIENGTVAIIEMAACAGLPLVAGRADPLKTTTYGVGQLIDHALDSGCRKIVMGLGGSSTNEGGCGAAAALGAVFRDEGGNEFIPTGGTLCNIAEIDLSGLNPRLLDTEIVTMCDIDNPLYGETGAAYIFGPQKGATPEVVRQLDEGLRVFAACVESKLCIHAATEAGAGAAGGMGYGMVVFFGSRLQAGIDTVLDTVRFDALASGADVVFTGEGKIDTQSLRGKVVIGIARRAKPLNVPVVAVVGGIGDGVEPSYDMGVTAIFSINRLPQDLEISKHHSADNLRISMDNILRLLKL